MQSAAFALPLPFALSLSKGFDKLSPNGWVPGTDGCPERVEPESARPVPLPFARSLPFARPLPFALSLSKGFDKLIRPRFIALQRRRAALPA